FARLADTNSESDAAQQKTCHTSAPPRYVDARGRWQPIHVATCLSDGSPRGSRPVSVTDDSQGRAKYSTCSLNSQTAKELSMNHLRRWLRPAAGARRPVSCRPQLEALESRLVPSSSSRPAVIRFVPGDGQLHVFETRNGHLYDRFTPDNYHWPPLKDVGAP